MLRKHVDYDSFGNIVYQTYYHADGLPIEEPDAFFDPEAVDQSFYFQGQERDEVTGLQYHSDGRRTGRWYDPTIGRWMSQDPIGFAAGDANLYRYVGNSPLNYTDPTGLVQAGNPLTNLNVNAGGYSGNKVTKAKPVNPYVASGGLNLGTLGSVLGNSVYNTAGSYIAPGTKAALSAGVSLATSIPAIGQVRSNSSDRHITQFGGQSIPARQQGELPIRVQQAIQQPNSYLVSPHQGQGYFIADPSGAVHFVNNPEVLPTVTLMNRARSEVQAAKNQQGLARLAGEVLISASPLHDAARDIGIAGFGYDYYEPNQRFTAQERLQATLFTAAPGGNSGQVKYVDELLNAVPRRLPQDLRVAPTPPAPKPLNRNISQSPTQNARAQRDAQRLLNAGAEDVRINQQQVNSATQRVGINRPDLQYTNPKTGQRVYIEYESPGSSRGPSHTTRTLSNDPNAKVIIRTNSR